MVPGDQATSCFMAGRGTRDPRGQEAGGLGDNASDMGLSSLREWGRTDVQVSPSGRLMLWRLGLEGTIWESSSLG
jgi:hypothetical protein